MNLTLAGPAPSRCEQPVAQSPTYSATGGCTGLRVRLTTWHPTTWDRFSTSSTPTAPEAIRYLEVEHACAKVLLTV